MRFAVALVVAFACSPAAFAGTLHKCKARSGSVYYTDKSCSLKNERDRPVFDKKADSTQPAPPPAQKKKKAAKP